MATAIIKKTQKTYVIRKDNRTLTISQVFKPTGTPGVLAGDVTGSVAANTVEAIQNVPVASAPPSTGQVLKYDGSQYTPQDDESISGAAAGGDLFGTYPNPSVAQFGVGGVGVPTSAPTIGQVLKATSTTQAEWADETGGGGGATLYIAEYIPTAGQTVFILPTAPTSPSTLTFKVNGTSYNQDVDYTVTGSTIVWTNARFTLDPSDEVEVLYQ